LQDPARSQLGSAQREWLFAGLSESTTRWRLLANSSVMGQTWAPGITPEVRSGLRALKLINAEAGPDPDQWDGYPVERDQLLQRLTGRDAVLLSGDVHVGLANELRRSAADPASDPAAVEFVTASLTSQNLDDKMGWGYRAGSLAVEQQLLELLPQIRWCDLDSHGYMVVDVTPQRIDAEWWFVDGVLERSTGERLGKRFTVHFGSSRMQPS
jgi:alkaline phosphatase D